MLQESNSTLRLSIKVRKTIFKSTLRTVDAVESVSYCVQQDGKSSRSRRQPAAEMQLKMLSRRSAEQYDTS